MPLQLLTIDTKINQRNKQWADVPYTGDDAHIDLCDITVEKIQEYHDLDDPVKHRKNNVSQNVDRFPLVIDLQILIAPKHSLLPMIFESLD